MADSTPFSNQQKASSCLSISLRRTSWNYAVTSRLHDLQGHHLFDSEIGNQHLMSCFRSQHHHFLKPLVLCEHPAAKPICHPSPARGKKLICRPSKAEVNNVYQQKQPVAVGKVLRLLRVCDVGPSLAIALTLLHIAAYLQGLHKLAELEGKSNLQ